MRRKTQETDGGRWNHHRTGLENFVFHWFTVFDQGAIGFLPKIRKKWDKEQKETYGDRGKSLSIGLGFLTKNNISSDYAKDPSSTM